MCRYNSFGFVLQHREELQYNNTIFTLIYRQKYQHETHGQFASDAARSAGQGSHIGNQCSPGCPFLHPAGPAGVRPICLVRLIESHAPLLRFAFAIFSVFLLPEKNLSQSLGDCPFFGAVLSFRDRLVIRFVSEHLKEICNMYSLYFIEE